MTTTTKFALIAATLFTSNVFFADVAFAEGDVDAGKEIAYSCLGCHGIDGYRNAYPSYRVPKLGGQKAAYLEIALKGYRDGTREHPTMTGQASSLSNQQIEDVAAYLAGVNNETVVSGGSESQAFELAATCSACHGNNGVSVNALWPTLAGQHEDYFLHAMQGYRDGTRKDPVMSAQASLVEESDLKLLAEYFAGLDGLETTKPE